MEKELITTETIINYLKKNVEDKINMPISTYLDAALKLTILLEDEDDKLIKLHQQVAEKKSEFLKDDMSVAKANVIIEASDEYVELKKQKAKCERILEFIRIAKLSARLKEDEFNNY